MQKKKRNTDETNYWEPMADSLLGLLFCILLILLLLILYILRNDTNDKVDYEYGDTYATTYDDDEYATNPTLYDHDGGYVYVPTEYHDDDGGGGDDGDGDGEDDYPDPYPGREGDGVDKAAVFVQVVDGETNRTIKERGIQFELYTDRNVRKILSTYYPDKIEYKKYETDDAGIFYLPEKIEILDYYFKNLTTVIGYDKADNVSFSIPESYDWPDPYVVTIPLFPSKNIIKVQLKDAETGDKITGAAFDVIAAEDIRTKDETLRFSKGEVVDTIKLDETGYGESIQLYLGKYTLEQKIIPEFYAKTENVNVQVADKSKGAVAITEIRDPKTTVFVNVQDALYDTTKLEGAEFVLSGGKDTRTFRTDNSGLIKITDLAKNTKYNLRQTAANDMYLIDSESHTFTVDSTGFIEQNVVHNITVENTIIRLSFGVCDYLLRGQISDVNMALFDKSDEVVRLWNSSGLEQLIEGIDEGEYLVVMKGRKNKGRPITVEAVPDIQIHTYYMWTTTDTIIVIVLSIVLILFIFFLIKFLIKRHRRKNDEKKGKVTT